jgi:hypothetical protein
LLAVAVGLQVACSSVPPASARDVADANDTGRALAASDATERALLGQVAMLPSGSPQRVAGVTVSAEQPYAAASGRKCRALIVTTTPSRPPTSRLACSDGAQWFFVPDVFGAEKAEPAE